MSQSQKLLNEKIDRMVARAFDLHGRVLQNCGIAQHPNDLIGLKQVQDLIKKAIPTIPKQGVDIYCQQAQISGLRLGRGDQNTRVHVTDYCHILYWDGQRFWFDGDDGSDFYVLRDSSSNIPSVGWHAADGSTVSFLKQDGTLGSKTLMNSVSQSGYISIGTGTGGFSSAVAPTINGSASLSGFSLSGSGSVGTGISGSATVGTTISGSATVASGVAIGGSITFGSSHIPLSGSVTISALGVGGSATVASSTGYANANLDIATFSVGGSASWAENDYTSNASATVYTGGLSAGLNVGSVSASYTAPFLSSGSDLMGDTDTSSAITGSSATFSAFYSSGGLSYSAGPSISVNIGSVTVSGPAAGQVTHNHTFSSSVNISGLTVTGGSLTNTQYIAPADLNSAIVLSALVTPTLTVPAAGLSLASGTVPASGLSLSSGTVSLSGVTISGSGTLTATAGTNGTPATYGMQLWYRQ